MSERITFTRNGQVRRGDIRVGWIVKRDDFDPPTWRLRFTAASDREGLVGDFPRLKDAKAEAVRILCPPDAANTEEISTEASNG